ncbi:hypothetical protein SAMD00019534_071440 [Acytostelium subglobosum LB1]|uniref:hypothetical protein n=1 Tax=Acytostelium subglobosum LB1 TaxID=1410327 RepID=UPI000644FAA1|nr:hypothetical protein SAMD00019534_071440 [Acytostelium subglobosum LB1]GAM23969.1 hypothetical protein SAMD00019534_071440 [Acytostelium subglobosum LB1]|eukprot:XP_012753005.1 hypothetical protein SAMD00019534_071440 [Acytostelium subglobosum LB1]
MSNVQEVLINDDNPKTGNWHTSKTENLQKFYKGEDGNTRLPYTLTINTNDITHIDHI